MISWLDFFPAHALAGGAGWSWVATVVPALLLLGVLSISNPMSAANLENYFMRLAQEQYYASALEEPGRWYGEGAAQLGLRGTVAREDDYIASGIPTPAVAYGERACRLLIAGFVAAVTVLTLFPANGAGAARSAGHSSTASSA